MYTICHAGTCMMGEHTTEEYAFQVSTLQNNYNTAEKQIVVRSSNKAPAKITFTVKIRPNPSTVSRFFAGMLHIDCDKITMESSDARLLVPCLVGGMHPSTFEIRVASGDLRFSCFQLTLTQQPSFEEMSAKLDAMSSLVSNLLRRDFQWDKRLGRLNARYVQRVTSRSLRATMAISKRKERLLIAHAHELQENRKKLGTLEDELADLKRRVESLVIAPPGSVNTRASAAKIHRRVEQQIVQAQLVQKQMDN